MFNQRWSSDKTATDSIVILSYSTAADLELKFKLGPISESFKWADVREEIHWVCRWSVSLEKAAEGISAKKKTKKDFHSCCKFAT